MGTPKNNKNGNANKGNTNKGNATIMVTAIKATL
jgi:hypothetical protein